ncbi:MAG: hypothetical protein QOE60_643 [Thermoleophilaceae bacterium]|nr:hypothetical protein [Thermoleophilaceae bacterium]
MAEDLATRLEELQPEVEWRVPVVVDGLVSPPALTTELIDATHQRLLREDWELALCLTDLPLRIGRRPVEGQASPTHRVAVLSMPALGAARLRRRALDTAAGLVSAVLGDRGSVQRLVDLAELAHEDPEHGPAGLAALARGGNLRLLVGMVRANRPWRLAARLYRALVAALAAVAIALVTSDVWRISASLSGVRLVAISVLSIGLTAASLIAAHGLWQPGGGGRAADQVMLFNAATTATVLLGVLSLYGALLVLTLTGAGLLITPDTFSAALGTDTGFGDYVRLAWFVSSLATVGGALGAGLESDEAVREAAYAYRPDDEARQDQG